MSSKDGITVRQSLQITSATKSAQSRHAGVSDQCPLSGVKRTSLFAAQMSAFDPKMG
jgi:hypothetical protein